VGDNAASLGSMLAVQLRYVTKAVCVTVLVLWAGDAHTDPQSGQVPFPHGSVFTLHPQSAWLVEVSQQV